MKTLAAAFWVALVLGLFGGPVVADGRKKLVVVVAKGSTLTNISRSALKRCFTGETITVGDKRLIPFNASPSSPERVGFDTVVLGMSPDQMGRFWVDRKIRGQSGAPRSLPSPAHIAKVAAKFPGAIGYLPTDQLTADIQPVSVDGVAYTDAGYDVVAF